MEELHLDPIGDSGLFISDLDSAQQSDLLEQHGIRSVLALGRRFDDYEKIEGIEYELMIIKDDAMSILKSALVFIQHAKKPILVHSTNGVSESASVCTAYLMNLNNWSYEKAFAVIQAARPCVKPDPRLRYLEPAIAYDNCDCFGFVKSLLRILLLIKL